MNPGSARYVVLAALLVLVAPDPARAASQEAGSRQVLQVGPGHPYAVPSEAARVARDGALVEIAAGEYSGDVAVWSQDDLVLRGVGPRPHLKAAGRAAQGKAIWVIRGNRVTVENLEFSGTRVPSRNGAGIRAEGLALTIRNCRFHDNEMGLLTNNVRDAVVVIENSEFDNNRADTESHGRLGHNVYIGRIRRFELRDSQVHGALIGHQVKTRARRNVIAGNRIHDGDGAGSFLLDISEGGHAEVTGNSFQQSARSRNRTAIAFAPEARDRKSGHTLRVVGNTFVNEGGSGTFVRNFSDAPAVLRDNTLTGRITPLRGEGQVR